MNTKFRKNSCKTKYQKTLKKHVWRTFPSPKIFFRLILSIFLQLCPLPSGEIDKNLWGVLALSIDVTDMLTEVIFHCFGPQITEYSSRFVLKRLIYKACKEMYRSLTYTQKIAVFTTVLFFTYIYSNYVFSRKVLFLQGLLYPLITLKSLLCVANWLTTHNSCIIKVTLCREVFVWSN